MKEKRMSAFYDITILKSQVMAMYGL